MEILNNQGFVTSELVLNAFNGFNQKERMLLKLFSEHNDEYEKRVEVNRVEASYRNYLYSYRLLKEFIKYKYSREDIALKSLKLPFIDAYDFYLRVERRMSPYTISGHTIILKKMIRRAIRQGTLLVDPFYNYIPEQPERKCRHLSMEEIKKIMEIEIKSASIRHTRDMFVFSCFTGLSYSDLKNLSEEHISYASDGSMWININRKKTKSRSTVKLLEIPILIIEKYKNVRKSDKIFNLITSSCISRNLKELEKICGIKHITFHMARHNFGTHITLSQGVPIETVRRMMGHTSLTTTQIYAKITNQKVKEDMKCLKTKLSDKFTILEDRKMPVGIYLNQNFRSNKDN